MPSGVRKKRRRENIAVAAVCLVLLAGTAIVATVAPWSKPRRDVTVPILMYHKVGEKAHSRWWVSVDEFSAQMRALEAYGYRTVPLIALYEHSERRRRLPAKPVIITFDDGYQNNYTLAYPALKAVGFTGTIAIVPSLVGEDEESRKTNDWDAEHESRFAAPHLIWPEVLEMARHGFEFISHSMTHPILTRTDDLTRELVDSRKAMEERLGRPMRVLCYPFGLHNSRVVQEAVSAGYRVAVDCRGDAVDTATADLMRLERIGIVGGETSVVFRGEPRRFFMTRLDPDFPVPLIRLDEIRTETAGGEVHGAFAPGEQVVVAVTVRNEGAEQEVVPELMVSVPGPGGEEGPDTWWDRLPQRTLAEGESATLKFNWEMPREGSDGPYRVRIKFHDRTGTLVFLDTGWAGPGFTVVRPPL